MVGSTLSASCGSHNDPLSTQTIRPFQHHPFLHNQYHQVLTDQNGLAYRALQVTGIAHVQPVVFVQAWLLN